MHDFGRGDLALTPRRHRVMASELSPRGIRVNVVSPGGTSTPIWNSSAPTPGGIAALEQRISQAVPLGRFGKPEEVAKTAYPGRGDFRRWRRDGFPRRRADLSRIELRSTKIIQSAQRDLTKSRISVALSGSIIL